MKIRDDRMQVSGDGIADIRPPKAYPVNVHDTLKSSYGWIPTIEDDNIILRVSKSSMNTFTFCEQQYFIKYILGVKEVENDDMRRGTNVHDALEDFYDAIDLEKAQETLDSYGPQGLIDYFRGFIPSASKEKTWGGVLKPSQPFTLGEEEHLRKLMVSEASRFISSDIDHFRPVINEDSLDAVIDLEVDGRIVFVHLTGIIDRAFMDANGDIHIHELKTGLWKHTDFKKESMQKEMAFYVYLLRKSKGHPLSGKTATYWGWDHTRGDVDGSDKIYRFVENVRSEAIQDVLKDLKSLVRMHLKYTGNNNGWMFPQKPNGWATTKLCEPWCRVKGFCPKYGRVLMPHEMKAGID